MKSKLKTIGIFIFILGILYFMFVPLSRPIDKFKNIEFKQENFILNQTNKPIEVSLFDWIQISNFKLDFGFLLDQLSLLWLLFVTGIGSLIHLYSISYMHDDENMHKFFAYLNLFIFLKSTFFLPLIFYNFKNHPFFVFK
jgi:hypothetical protein